LGVGLVKDALSPSKKDTKVKLNSRSVSWSWHRPMTEERKRQRLDDLK